MDDLTVSEVYCVSDLTSDIYSESAVWLCENRKTGFKTRIQGSLTQVLKQYPQDYRLKLLFIKENRHEQPAATH